MIESSSNLVSFSAGGLGGLSVAKVMFDIMNHE